MAAYPRNNSVAMDFIEPTSHSYFRCQSGAVQFFSAPTRICSLQHGCRLAARKYLRGSPCTSLTLPRKTANYLNYSDLTHASWSLSSSKSAFCIICCSIQLHHTAHVQSSSCVVCRVGLIPLPIKFADFAGNEKPYPSYPFVAWFEFAAPFYHLLLTLCGLVFLFWRRRSVYACQWTWEK